MQVCVCGGGHGGRAGTLHGTSQGNGGPGERCRVVQDAGGQRFKQRVKHPPANPVSTNLLASTGGSGLGGPVPANG